jgi:phenylpropionate dioxygenase-like ring-hydroxylating dioxygenase large terminal subunit
MYEIDDAQLVSCTTNGSVYAVDHRIYIDEELYRQEQSNIFGRLWVLVGLESEIPNPGSFKTTYVGERPVIVLRDEKSAIRVFENVCVHRGAKLVRKNCGTAKSLTCLYHQWNYALDGRLIGVPMPSGFPASFKKEDFRLSELPRVAVLAGLIFAAYDKTLPSLEEYLSGVVPLIKEVLRDGEIELLGYANHRVKANWKLFVENTVDGYHPALLHKPIQSNRMQASYRPRAGGTCIAFVNGHNVLKFPTTVVDEKTWDPALDLPSLLCKSRDGGWDYVMNLFPNAMLLLLGDMLLVRQLIPRGVSAVDVIAYDLAYKDDSEDIKRHRARTVGTQLGTAGVASVDDKYAMEAIQQASSCSYRKTLLLRGDPEARDGDSNEEFSLRGLYEAWGRALGILNKGGIPAQSQQII